MSGLETNKAGSRTALWLVAILVGTLVLDALFFTGFYASDDISYSGATIALAHGDPVRISLAGLRLGVNGPASLIYRLTDGSLMATSFSYVGYHLALVLTAFFVGWLAHSRRTGLVAALITATCPITFVYAGSMLPDTAAAVWSALSLLFLLVAGHRERRLGSMQRTEAAVLFGLAGLAAGASYACKETGLIMLVPSGVAILLATRRWKSLELIERGAWFGVGLLLVFGLEVLAIRVFTGEWFFRLNIMFAAKSSYAAQPNITPWERTLYAYRRLHPVLPVLMWGFLATLLAYPFFRKRNWVVWAFGVWSVVYLTWGTTNFTAYAPPSIQVRYYGVAVLPLAVMSAGLLVAAFEWLLRLASRRPPGAFVRSLPMWGAVAVAVVVFALDLDVNWKFANNIYGGEFVRGFVTGYDAVRTRYPQYPIVLSGYYSRRMLPLLVHEDPHDVYVNGGRATTHIGSEQPPDPPYIFLDTVSRHSHYVKGGVGVVDPRFDPATMSVRTLDVVYPRPKRLDDLVDGVRAALRLDVSDPRGDLFLGQGGAVIQLVERNEAGQGDTDPFAFDTRWVPLMSFDRRARTFRVPDGYVVRWADNVPERFYLQLAETGSYRRPATSPFTHFAEPVEKPRASMILSAEADPVTAIVYYYVYAGPDLVDFAKETVQVDRSTPLELEVPADQAVDTFRVRILVRPRVRRAGSLRIDRFEVSGAPALQDTLEARSPG